MSRRMTWDEMVTEYPNQWVVIDNPQMDGADVVSAELIAVVEDDEIISYRMNNQNQSYRFYRTTEELSSGIIDADIDISVE